MANVEVKAPEKSTEAEVKVPETAEVARAERAAPAEWWRPLESLRREVDRLFEDFDRGIWRLPRRVFDIEPFGKRGAWPAMDLVEREKDYQVSAELPGMSERDIQLSVANGMLSIKGEKKEEKEEKRKDYYMSERRYGAFERALRLPEKVDAEQIEAHFKGGVLTVTLPKKPEAIRPVKNIEVKPG